MALTQQTKVIVAGGSSGIGRAVAQHLAARQVPVVITGRDKEKIGHLTAHYPTIVGNVVDSSDRSELNSFFARQGPFTHLVVALSGGKGGGSFRELKLDDLRAGFEGKFWPQLNTLQAALPHLSHDGSVTLMTSISAQSGHLETAGLAAINAAIEAMVPVLAKELQPLRVNAVAPGVIDTPWWHFLPQAQRDATFRQYEATIPVGRVGTPDDVAGAVLFLLENPYVTGTVLACDGGLRL